MKHSQNTRTIALILLAALAVGCLSGCQIAQAAGTPAQPTSPVTSPVITEPAPSIPVDTICPSASAESTGIPTATVTVDIPVITREIPFQAATEEDSIASGTPKKVFGQPQAAESEENAASPETSAAPETEEPPKASVSQEITEPPKASVSQETTEPPKATESTTTAKPTGSSRPTSSATSRDTGSNAIWDDPAGRVKDNFEEHDPERKSYLEYLEKYQDPNHFTIIVTSLQMHVGRTYGIPLAATPEVFLSSVWSVSDPSIATINEVGFMTTLKEGEVTVTVSYTNPETQDVKQDQRVIRIEKEPTITIAELEQLAKEEAKRIANYVKYELGLSSDLERIAAAAAIINQYVESGRSTSMVSGYNQPFGTLITGYSSCAGSTRAMGLVLEYMGFDWYHVNANQWDHQWCVVYDVDGQTAFADGSWVGVAGYGSWLTDQPYRYSMGSGLSPYNGGRPF